VLGKNSFELGLVAEKDIPQVTMVLGIARDITERNKAAEEIVGYTEAELIGKSLVEMGLLSSDQVLRAIANLEKNAMGKPTGPEEVCDCLEDVIRDTRTLTFDLSSPILYELGFETAVSEWLDEQIREKHANTN